MLDAVNPFLHLLSNKRLFSKFHGPFFSTHLSWYSEPNLNCWTSWPTSTICKSEPIFQADLKVFFSALWFCCLFDKSLPKRLKEHSSNRSDLHRVVMLISSSSFFVKQRLRRPSTTACSIAAKKRRKGRTLVMALWMVKGERYLAS